MRKTTNEFVLKLLFIFTFSRLVSAICPGNSPCSGHGSCGSWDLCTCHKGWTGYDCSERVCPYGRAFSDIKNADVTGREEHYYAECSSKGDCNRGNGECACFNGFEGSSCQRMSCPSDCSGHGTCELMSEVNSGYGAWDADKIQVCQCDPGWHGEACDLRTCKPGDDPLTLHTVNGAAYQQDEVQSLRFTDSGSGALTGEFTLTYTDWRGKDWETFPITVETATAISIEEALEALPNQAVPSVTVTTETNTAASGDLKFHVTFSSEATSGDQPLLKVNYAGCDIHGCQPVYSGVTSAGTTAAVVATVTSGTEENIECSKRGTCNSGTGLCECFAGYYGEACQYQTIMT